MALVLSIAQEFANNVDTELNKRGLSLAGVDRVKSARLRRVVRGEDGKEVSETGQVLYKKEFKFFPKLPLELRRMIWKLSTPVFRHRVITIEYRLDENLDRDMLGCSTITYPRHPALAIMLVCKEAKTAIKGAHVSMATQRVCFDDDIFYFHNNPAILYSRPNFIPSIFLPIKRLMMPMRLFDEMLMSDDKYARILSNLPALQDIILLDFQHCYVHLDHSRHRTKRGYSIYNYTPWIQLEPPTSVEAYEKDAADEKLMVLATASLVKTKFRTKFVDMEAEEAEHESNDKDLEAEFLSSVRKISIYYIDASNSKCRVKPKVSETD